MIRNQSSGNRANRLLNVFVFGNHIVKAGFPINSCDRFEQNLIIISRSAPSLSFNDKKKSADEKLDVASQCSKPKVKDEAVPSERKR